MKCTRCGYDDNGTGDSAHVCTKNHWTKADITPDFLKQNDGKLVWIRDDYLSMKGICYHSDPELYDFLTHVDKVKELVHNTGYRFKA